ncbi:MAG: family 20 glycosylhydrolase [Verrucomicrobiales bacterium]|nr:family 20 glycosylhydrolase [Verrucomicrobiales bacterium]
MTRLPTRPTAHRVLVLTLLLSSTLLGPKLVSAEAASQGFPVRGLAIAAPQPRQIDRFLGFLTNEFAPRGGNTLILRVDFGFEFESRPDLRAQPALSKADVKRLVDVARPRGIRLIPQINLLGHQSWSTTLGNLLRVHPEFDETPWVKMPTSYQWPNPDRLYCKSYCPLHPGVHGVVLPLVDEVCDAFETDAFHAGMDEVFYLGEEKGPRCAGKNKAELFAGEVKRIRDHLATRQRQLWIWGDRLIDGAATGIGEWEASLNDTHPAIDLIPKDVVICDWHYERPDPTAVLFALKGFQVVTCPWRNPGVAVQQVADMARWRSNATPKTRDRFHGIVQTAWSGVDGFLNEFEQARNSPSASTNQTAGNCFLKTSEQWAPSGPAPNR